MREEEPAKLVVEGQAPFVWQRQVEWFCDSYPRPNYALTRFASRSQQRSLSYQIRVTRRLQRNDKPVRTLSPWSKGEGVVENEGKFEVGGRPTKRPPHKHQPNLDQRHQG